MWNSCLKVDGVDCVELCKGRWGRLSQFQVECCVKMGGIDFSSGSVCKQCRVPTLPRKP